MKAPSVFVIADEVAPEAFKAGRDSCKTMQAEFVSQAAVIRHRVADVAGTRRQHLPDYLTDFNGSGGSNFQPVNLFHPGT
jgi:hypothetical protein